MRAFRFAGTAVVFLALMASTAPAYAQDAAAAQALRAEIDQLKKDFDARLADLESRLAALGGAPPSGVAAEPVTPPQTSTPAACSRHGGRRGRWRAAGLRQRRGLLEGLQPRHGGDRQLPRRNGKERGQPAAGAATVRIRGVVPGDRRSLRARRFLPLLRRSRASTSKRATSRSPRFPADLLMKVGKMRAAFGKVNTLHTHVLPWTDRPLVTDNLVGGDEGIDDAGISVARLIPNPWIFLEATGQVFRGDSDDVFHSTKRGDLSYVGHLRGYHDVNESTNLDLGVSYARGHNPSGIPGGGDAGADRPLHHEPVRRGREPCDGVRCGGRSITRSSAAASSSSAGAINRMVCRVRSGFYLSGDYQLGRRWFTGLRFDRSDLLTNARSARLGPVARHHLLAERVQSGSRTGAPNELRGRRDRERVPVPVPVCDWRARRASVLDV